MIMDFVPNSNLMKYLATESNKISWRMKLKIASNIAGTKYFLLMNRFLNCYYLEAVRFLHHQTPKIIHRDLKSPNILVTTEFCSSFFSK
jgi:serine/threonine protein kinase